MSVLNVLVVVTVTVITRCPPGQLVASGVEHSLADGAVAENVPVSDAHWHNLVATASIPGVLVAASAVASIPAMSAVRAGE
jgi:hypothetical protein